MEEENYDKIKKMFEILVKNKKVSHAYIFEGTNSLINKESVFLFNKIIEEEFKIDNEVKIIETEDKMLKKEEILNLRIDGEKTTMKNGFKIFAIIDAEKMNLHSANSLLKFIEEPVDNVIIILTVKNKYQILETILSRCQQINIDMYIDKCKKIEYDEQILKDVANFILTIEKKQEKALVEINEFWSKNLEQFITLEQLLDLMILFYKDVLNYCVNIDLKYYNSCSINIEKLKTINSLDKITNKISFLVKCRDKLKYNINKNLLIDKIIIYLSRGE